MAAAGSGYSNGIGHAFTVSTDITVKSLIFEGWAGGGGTVADAANDAGTLQLWNVDTVTVLATYTISGNADASAIAYAHGTYAGIRHDGSIADVALTTGVNYMISVHTFGGGLEYINGASTQTIGAEISHVRDRYHATTAGAMPNVDDTAGLIYGGPSFSYDITPVPEPSSTALLGLGGLALILRRRK